MRELIRINQPFLGKEEIDAAVEVLRSGILTDKSGMGPRVLEFERGFAKFVGAKHAIAVVNGTAALHAALLAADVGQGDEVILPSFTFVGAANAVVLTGATPVFADIDKDNYCLRMESVEECVSRKTKAIIPTDMYGFPSDISAVSDLARGKDIVVIEDAAQAHGAMIDGKRVGSIADMTCFSFYSGKNLTTGEGGMVTTNDDGYAQTLRMVRSHGEQRPYWTVRPGHNYHMTEIAAAIGYQQLKKLPSFLEKRRKNAELTTERLNMTGKLFLPKETDGRKHSWYLYTVRLRGVNAAKRNKIVDKLWNKNIEAGVYYSSPVHSTPYYRDSNIARRVRLPETEKASRQVFSLPVHPRLGETEIDYVAETLRKTIA
ncbi:MAG TPA: DegT/DnrJ/EryC1/StrS family aminotransferase [Candidatus Bathyarchaeia archaeon]|nr:DegT/DnrJ/EryC1/StrS family aminotransferase [Candidatus Bathyarchaeia archaeon]